MYFYPISESTEAQARLKLEAAIHNYTKEAAIADAIGETLVNYTGQFNRRLETWVNERLAKKYGTHSIERYDGKTEIGNVYVTFNKYPYGAAGNYELRFYYSDGKEASYNYNDDNTKTYGLQTRHGHETISAASDLWELKSHISDFIEYRNKSVPKFKANKKQLATLVKKHNNLAQQVAVFNDAITWPISDDLRIK